ncbi:dienelactone hydrolase family protein [Cytobacillus sp. IB215665]|uniref:dienelactone hydrolase family protein n=1 Tax=Cytobacillus sp. IB215665 TaxID=3097357 RepID=UPI002A0AD2A5|nr:dienelactone hydrolase family protein [Cytobacillus sp. IB215665]MDX8366987.1 dienelactone hydrolase family protein [Cytobacillus sp. IB215665]
MISYKNNSDKLVIIVHEIYGLNRHMKHICKELSNKGFDVICPNLYSENNAFHYDEEKLAYHHFVNKVGFDLATTYVKELLKKYRKEYSKIFILGYSVGGTVAWLCSEDQNCDGAISYYGSRIRDYLDMIPTCPTLLIFPENEKSFNVDQLITKLKDKEKITIKKYRANHGFSDINSEHYCELCAEYSFNELLRFICS